MPVSLRLDKETEELLERAAKILKATKSEVVAGSVFGFFDLMVEVG